MYLLSYEYNSLKRVKNSSFNAQSNFDDFAKKYCLSRLELLQGKQDVKICILAYSINVIVLIAFDLSSSSYMRKLPNALRKRRATGYPIETLIKSPGYRQDTSENNGLPRQVARAKIFSKCPLKCLKKATDYGLPYINCNKIAELPVKISGYQSKYRATSQNIGLQVKISVYQDK